MLYVFIKGIVWEIKQGINLLYIDETGLQLSNNNYYVWGDYNEEIRGGATKN